MSQKKKLDLNNLLAKYQTGSQSRANLPQGRLTYQPSLENEFYHNPSYEQPTPDIYTGMHFNQKTSNAHHAVMTAYGDTPASSIRSNFAKSKEECEHLLLEAQNQLKGQTRILNTFTEQALKQMLDDLEIKMKNVKREIIEIIDRAFVDSERVIRDEFLKMSKQQNPEFSNVHRKIGVMNDSILRLLDSLRGPEYRKAIAEVVVNDFNEEIKEIQMCSKAAKDNYSKFLGEVVVDHTRIDSIRDNLLSVFIFQARKYEYQDKASLGIANSKADGQSDGKRSRRSFFNFG